MFVTTLFAVLLAPMFQTPVTPISFGATPAPEPAHVLVPQYHVDGASAGDYLGFSIAVLPDLDADGVQDLLVGLPNRNVIWPTVGHAWVLSAKTGALLRQHGGANYADRFGRAVSVLPDLDHDGVAEYAVGATWAIDPPGGYGGDHPGSATIYGGASGSEMMLLGGYVTGECFGGGLAPLDDVTGDGTPDFAIGSRYGGCLGGDPATAPGMVRVFSGAAFQPVTDTSGGAPGDVLALESTITIPDQDGDGKVDIASGAIGYPSGASRGQVLTISSASGAVVHAVEGEADGDYFGWSLAALPDVDADGLADLLVGAPLAGPQHEGRAYVVSSSGTVLSVLTGTHASERFGSAVAAVGDQDGDGHTDYAIGASADANKKGRVDLVSGATGKLLASVTGGAWGEEFGFEVAAIPDLNGDGRPEIAVGAVSWPTNLAFGRMTVFRYR